jgi:signal recognition particle GTPase
MTKEERKNERLLHDQNGLARIAKGSGTSEKRFISMISEFNKMKKVFDNIKNDS